MRYPNLIAPQVRRETTATFTGYNANVRIGGGEFSQMENMTSDHYPTLAPRAVRRLYRNADNPQGFISRDNLCYVDGRYFVVDGYRVDLNLSEQESDCPKSLVSMGAYVVIFPDKKYISTVDFEDHGSLEAKFEAENVTVFPCDAVGTAANPDFTGSSEPAAFANGQLWLDTSVSPAVLRRWSENAGLWSDPVGSYVCIRFANIGKAFAVSDGVSITGIEGVTQANIICAKGDDFIVVSGICERQFVSPSGCITRQVPEMDFVIENENRLWGCRYGLSRDGQIVNELYASALGDFKNWNRFEGLSTDSYRVSLGSDGRFTGAVSHMGYPLFFKADCLHKIYGTAPSSFRLQTTPCRGVEAGSDQSLAIVGETLCYKSPSGVCAYDGSLPRDISSQLGKASYSRAVGAALGSKYYLAMKDEQDNGCLFVYDSAKGIWHREDDFYPDRMCTCRGVLYAADGANHRILELAGGSGSPTESSVSWYAVTGPIGGGQPDTRYLTALQVRLSMEEGSRVHFYLRYDSRGPWEHAGTLVGTGLGSFSVPIRPRRCDHLHLKIAGTGDAKIYAITRSLETGGEPA